MNRSRKLMTSFIMSVLLLSGFLYMRQEMAVKGSLRSPSHNHNEAPVPVEVNNDVIDVTDTAAESESPIDGVNPAQQEEVQNRLSADTNGRHVNSHFHGEQTGADGTWFYENFNNLAAGHTFVLLKPLIESADETDFYGYHLSQYGPRHQHFVLAKISVLENGSALKAADLYSGESPQNNFYSVSTSPRVRAGESPTAPFRLIDLLAAVGLAEAEDTGCELSATTTVTSCAVNMFDGTLLDSEAPAGAAPLNDFRRHDVSGSPGAAIQTVSQNARSQISSNRRVKFNKIARFEHIDTSFSVVSNKSEYVAIKYRDGATKDYYLVHRIKGNASYQQVVQVEFKNSVNLQNLKAYPIFKVDSLTEPMEEKRENSLVPGAVYALKVGDTPVEFEVKSNVLWLPMTPAQ